MPTQTEALPRTLTPRQALDLLADGNGRFVSNIQFSWSLQDQIDQSADGQTPCATIFSCIDSRISPEQIFDRALGDIISVRMAGTVLNEDVSASLEYAAEVAGSPLIVVMGNTRCDVVRAACHHVEGGELTALLAKIQPAICAVAEALDAAITPDAFVARVAREHTRRQLRAILENSPTLRRLHAEGRIGLAGAMYSVDSGEVIFFEERFTDGANAHAAARVSA